MESVAFSNYYPIIPFPSVPYALSAGNAVIAPGSVSLNMLSSDVQTSLGATIDRSRLSADVLADLNRTIGEDQLSAEVAGKLNRTIGTTIVTACSFDEWFDWYSCRHGDKYSTP